MAPIFIITSQMFFHNIVPRIRKKFFFREKSLRRGVGPSDTVITFSLSFFSGKQRGLFVVLGTLFLAERYQRKCFLSHRVKKQIEEE